MEFDEVIKTRRSIRGYLDKPVPKELIREILEIAMRAPTSMNSQPWNFYVVAGDVLDRIRKGNVERNVAGVPDSREFRMGPPYQGVHRDRQVEIAVQLFQAMGIERGDKEKRMDWVLRGFRQFDAPVSIVITYDKALAGGDIPPFDCGGVVNCIVNTAWSARARLRDQFARHHAKPRRARRGRHPGRSGHPDLRRHGLAGRHLPRQRRRLKKKIRRRSSGVSGVLGFQPFISI